MHILTLETRYATATISTYGAQVMSFTPKGGHDVLWQTSEEFLQKAVAATKPLRGGVPLCWPWFRGHPSVPTAPSHGLGRLVEWSVTSHTNTPEKATATLEYTFDGTHPAFPYKAKGIVTVTLTDTLTTSLTTVNTGAESFNLTQALHTYLRVGDIDGAVVEGLENTPRKHISSWTDQPPHTGPFPIQAEVEHLFSQVKGAINLKDAVNHRTLTVTNQGCHEVAVWNPWVEKTKGLDMPADGYRTMLCIEAANAEEVITLQPGQTHTLTTILSSSESPQSA